MFFMDKKILLSLLALIGLFPNAHSQETFPRNGAYDERSERYAFTNATIVVDGKTTISKGTLLIEKGEIREVGTQVRIPAGTVVNDLQGKYIYPSLIELHSDYGIPEIQQRGMARQAPQLESAKKGAFGWNQAVQPENESANFFAVNDKSADELRKAGFGAVLTHVQDGIVRGTGSFVSLTGKSSNEAMLIRSASSHYSFNKGTSTQNYPNSAMGAVALLRQTFYDADWYHKGGFKKETNLSLEAFLKNKSLPSFFEADDKWGIIRADQVGDEFGVQYIIKGSGNEYQRIEEIKKTGAAVIVPLNFPAAFSINDPWDAELISIAEMKHWEMAPANLAALEKAGIPFAVTASGLTAKTDLLKNMRKAISYGLSREKALDALTVIPASLIKADHFVGSLKKGKLANFLITSTDLFSEDNIIFENWVKGVPYVIADKNAVDLRGNYNLSLDNRNVGILKIGGTLAKPEYKIEKAGGGILTPKVQILNEMVTISYEPEKAEAGFVRLTGWKQGSNLIGEGETPDGQRIKWTAVFSSALESVAKKDSVQAKPEMGKMIFPFAGLGYTERPKSQNILIKNATVWTNEKDGILQNTDVLVVNGKISKIGKNLAAGTGVKTIDGTGKHLTTGIIDEHSHIALFSVNEGSQTSSAEVRMSDVINADDVNIYRQLAGGVTTSQLLHGSANSIGGQSAAIKLKWGAAPSELLLHEVKSIKFALGENVKQSNWGDANRIRFPQTRMGVEQVYFDHFIRAKEYKNEWQKFNSLRNKSGMVPPRVDIELDALVEILEGKRDITCHSYVQSEINMLMKVADSLNFKINTFTHILEGYKVADKMAERKIGGSTFADWWAYKMEVKEAIPQNAALMANEGVVVSINSDDAEMARRLNQEAAKTITFGNMSEEEAWKFVTLNPARLLKLDHRLGSIKAGKDGDLVLWNNHPLSVYSRPEFTIIEGAVYFDAAAEEQRQAEMSKEKARLIQQMMNAKSNGAPTRKLEAKGMHMWHCEDVAGEHHGH